MCICVYSHCTCTTCVCTTTSGRFSIQERKWVLSYTAMFSFCCHRRSLAAEPWSTPSSGVTWWDGFHRTGTDRSRKINCHAHAVQCFSLCLCVSVRGFCLSPTVCVCVSHLGRSFPFLLTDAEVLQAEAGFETLRAHSTCFVVQGLWTLCTDGLQKDRERERWEAANGFSKETFHFFLSSSLHFYTVPKVSPAPSVLTAPQDLQWCLRLVKLKLSLQPLHVCFSLSFFLELFWKERRTHTHRGHMSWLFSTETNVRRLVLLYPLFVFHFTFLLTQDTDKLSLP